jgi:2'-5' RNA ligase
VRLFIAAWPDAETGVDLSELTLRQLGSWPEMRLVGAGSWHVTLRFLGEVADDVMPALDDALTKAAGEVAGPVTCRIGPATDWFGRARALVLPVAGLDEVAAAVRAATDPSCRRLRQTSRRSTDT